MQKVIYKTPGELEHFGRIVGINERHTVIQKMTSKWLPYKSGKLVYICHLDKSCKIIKL
jgi:hypothetical protein